MFQKGTGERFKYKAAVKEKFPDAICKKSSRKSYNGNLYSRFLFAVWVDSRRISEAFYSAENAWADAWIKHIKQKQ